MVLNDTYVTKTIYMRRHRNSLGSYGWYIYCLAVLLLEAVAL